MTLLSGAASGRGESGDVYYLDDTPQKIVRTLETHQGNEILELETGTVIGFSLEPQRSVAERFPEISVVGVRGFVSHMRVLVKPAD